MTVNETTIKHTKGRLQRTVSALWPVALTLMVLFGLPAVVKSYKRLNRRQG